MMRHDADWLFEAPTGCASWSVGRPSYESERVRPARRYATTSQIVRATRPAGAPQALYKKRPPIIRSVGTHKVSHPHRPKIFHRRPRVTAVRAATAARKHFSARLRDVYANKLGVGKGGQVHHAIELQILKWYPGVFTPQELNDLKNMRGIPGELSDEVYERRTRALNRALNTVGLKPGMPGYNKFVRRFHARVGGDELRRRQLHNSYIRDLWDSKYKLLEQQIKERGLNEGTPAYIRHVRSFIIEARNEIDYLTQHFTTEARRKMDWSQSTQRF
jgi:hypothetical protein